jgi:hypothetical protein
MERIPARSVLEQMSSAERASSLISVEFESSDSGAVLLGHKVERLWNGGQFDDALLQLGNLEARVGHVAIGNSWRKPVLTIGTHLWGRDVRIGNRDSMQALSFDVHDSTGNLFVALRHNATPPHFSVCMSTDGGSTWAETFTWSGNLPPTTIGAGVYINRLYVAYNSPADDPQSIRVRRFRCGDGMSDGFPGGGAWTVAGTLDSGKVMKEVSFAPGLNLYLVTLVSDGTVLTSIWHEGLSFWGSIGYATGAGNGLAATGDPGWDTTLFLVSYYDTSGTLRVRRENWDQPRVLSLFTGMGTTTSTSAYGDTIICAFEDETFSPCRVRYAINYGDSDTWKLGTLSSPDTAAEAPAIVAGNGVLGAVYCHSGPSRDLRFRQSPFGDTWSGPISIADHEPCLSRPGIRYLSKSGAFGVVYMSDTSPVMRGAYFDRSDWLYGIAEQRRLIAAEIVLSVFPNPLSGRGRLTYTLNCPAHLRLQVYDCAGRAVRTLFDGRSSPGRQPLGFDATGMTPGVYFVRADADGRALTVPVTVVK